MQQTLLKRAQGAKLGVMGYPTPAPSPSSFSQQSNYVEPSLKRFQQVQAGRCPTDKEAGAEKNTDPIFVPNFDVIGLCSHQA